MKSELPVSMAINLSKNRFGTIFKRFKKKNLSSTPDEFDDYEDYIEEISVDEDNFPTINVSVSKSSTYTSIYFYF